MSSVFLAKTCYSILVVDDDPDMLNLLKSPLVREGYHVSLAVDGFQAMAILGQRAIDLILSDVDMPGMDGYELVRQVKQSAQTAEIPFLFFSAFSEVDDRLKGLELGANDYIPKPFNPKEVCLRVRNVLDQQALRDERQARAITHALDLIPLGIVVLDGNSEVRLMNRVAREIIDQVDGLVMRDQKLIGRTVAETRRIEALITEARTLATSFDPAKINPIHLSRPSQKRDFSLIALPSDVSSVYERNDRRVVSIIIHDPESTNIPSTKLLINSYHFTQAEARVASLLIQGKSISEICEELEVSRNTVCTHLKKLYSKTETQRQSEFTTLLLNGLSQLKFE